MSLGRYDEAPLATEQAIRFSPNHSYNIASQSLLLRVVGRVEDSLRQIKRAMRLSPISPMWYFVALGAAHHLLGNQELALEALREAVSREPDSLLPKPWFVSILAESGLEPEAKTVVKDLLRLHPAFTVTKWIDGFNYKDAAIRARLLDSLTKAGLPK